MSFPTPGNTTTETETETETETTVFGGEREELYETYWGIVDAYRAVRKLATTHLFPGEDRVKNKEIVALKNESPIARDFDFYAEQKTDIKKRIKAADDLPKGASLPKYREEFGELEADYEVLNVENAEEWGIDPETFRDDEDDILVPTAYEPETDDDGNLVVRWDDSGLTVDRVLAIAEETDGIGEKTLKALKENLNAAL